MKMRLFFKTFLWLILSFSFVFFLTNYLSKDKFSPLYLEENITSVKSSILTNTTKIKEGTPLSETSLMDLSSETGFILYQDGVIKEQIGNISLNESEILSFVVHLYDKETSIKEGNLLYHIEMVYDIYHINYIYQFELGTYLIIETKIQSLRNIDSVLNKINETEAIYFFIVITLLSLILSYSVVRPIKKITGYAQELSKLNFKAELNLKRKDEFKILTTALNEMTHNLKKAYQDLNDLNLQLEKDMIYEKRQEEKKKALIHMINHELRTPLSVMKGMIEGMIDGVGRYKDKDKYLNELLTQIDLIENLTKDLTYSLKIEDKMNPDDVVLTSTLRKELLPLYEYAKQRQVKIHERLKDTTLLMNDELFYLLVKNLLKNAITYTKDNEVSIESDIHGDFYLLTIRNKGHLDETETNDLFSPFYRGKEEKDNEKGTGLGLSIVKQITDLYHYRISLFNDGDDVVASVKINIKL